MARETAQEKLPISAHQVMHACFLDAAIAGAKRVYHSGASDLSKLESEMARLHQQTHRDMFWSPVTSHR